MRHVVKIDRYGRQVRVTIPKDLVEKTAFKTAAYALAWKGAGEYVVILPFLDKGLLNEAIQKDRG